MWRFLSHMADALQYLHDQHPPIIHRDLKPDNILCWTNPSNGLIVNKIADFGIARVLKQNAYAEYYCGTAIGTPIYMAPEALTVRQEVFRRSQISIYQLVIHLSGGEVFHSS